ncbi:DUF1214 domain-containing protein [Candidatus Viadribacter manganicus]|uniref:DUF1214 domain-containing protein n=1 Tax=Candidatus Viadribacter manganicus TaxID=1759059 RepID=A0A1B1AIR2_9PROT|nr:DUF1214 domain-containing protein [Candidatus Viadribacter manganicus]ANP46435.1 hypothetical protein ATE48_11160 [Candidatus Viadribacter manganicus]
MLRQILIWIAAIVAGVLLGLASAWATLHFGASTFTEHYGHWVFSRAAGSTAAGPYTRAIIARDGLLALSAREAVYFSMYQDEQGRALDEGCVYELNGRPLDARWWSVTLYADDNFLAQNTDNAHSLDASRAGNDAPWAVRISPVRGDATHWISSREARRGFIIMLRVYNPQRDFRPSKDALPVLTTISCAGDAP